MSIPLKSSLSSLWKVFLFKYVNPRPYWEDAVGAGGEKGERHISLSSRFTVMIFNLNFHQGTINFIVVITIMLLQDTTCI